MDQIRLAIITTHPIQYNAPLFNLIAESGKFKLKVFYTWDKGAFEKYDPGFGKEILWDIPLLNGYEYSFVNNTSKKPGSDHFWGIINPTLNKEIIEWGADVILVYGWALRSHLGAMFYFKGKLPVFFRGDSHLLNEKFGLKQVIRRVLLIWIYRHIDYAFYVGSNNRNYYLKHGLKETKLLWAPHSINNDLFSQNKIDRINESIKLRTKLSIHPENLVILFAGKLEPKKDPKLLLQAFLLANNTNLHLVFVGTGVLEDELKQISTNKKNIHFLGFQNQSLMPIMYQLCDVLCLPSKGPEETWGLSINEAMACGKAIIASNKVGCAADLVKQNYNGFIFESNNFKELQNIIKFDLEKEKLSKMGQNSLELISEWSVNKTADIMINAILEKCDY